MNVLYHVRLHRAAPAPAIKHVALTVRPHHNPDTERARAKGEAATFIATPGETWTPVGIQWVCTTPDEVRREVK